jgi:hypothetical protein
MLSLPALEIGMYENKLRVGVLIGGELSFVAGAKRPTNQLPAIGISS